MPGPDVRDGFAPSPYAVAPRLFPDVLRRTRQAGEGTSSAFLAGLPDLRRQLAAEIGEQSAHPGREPVPEYIRDAWTHLPKEYIQRCILTFDLGHDTKSSLVGCGTGQGQSTCLIDAVGHRHGEPEGSVKVAGRRQDHRERSASEISSPAGVSPADLMTIFSARGDALGERPGGDLLPKDSIERALDASNQKLRPRRDLSVQRVPPHGGVELGVAAPGIGSQLGQHHVCGVDGAFLDEIDE